MTPLIATYVLMAPTIADPSEAFFKSDAPVATIKLEVDKANISQIRRDPRKYAKATLKLNDEVLVDIGIHLKGAAGSYREWNDKPALTLNSDKFTDDQSFHGLDKFHLNNSLQDEVYLNEILFGEIFRAAGVPTPRATQVFVELNDRKVGLYVLREGFDKTFLSRHFKNIKGNLYDGGFLTDIDEKDRKLQLDSGPGCDWKDVRDLGIALRLKDHKERLKQVEKLLDVDKFIAMWVIEVMGCDWDGYTRNRNNYRVYHDPTSDKLVFFPHGKDQMFQNVNDELVPGWGGLVARRLWDTEDGRKLYITKVKAVLEKHFKLEDLNKRIDEWSLRLRDPLNAFQKGLGDRYLETVKSYKSRVKARVEYLKREVPKLKP